MLLLRVAELMERNKLNQKQLLQLTGIHPNTISEMRHQLTKEQRLPRLYDTAMKHKLAENS